MRSTDLLGSECREFVEGRYGASIELLVNELRSRVDESLAKAIARLCEALSSPIRIEILMLLKASGKPLPTCLIAFALGKSPQLVSYHLRSLKSLGLVKEVQLDKFKLYSIDDRTASKFAKVLAKLASLLELQEAGEG